MKMNCPKCGKSPNGHLHQIGCGGGNYHIFDWKALRMREDRGDPDIYTYRCPNCMFEITDKRKDAIAFLGMGNISEEMAKRFAEKVFEESV